MFSGRLKELGGQFLLHTREELVLLRAQLPQARRGQDDALLEMRRVAHRIHGSGAMLGFTAISAVAGQIERILYRAAPAPNEADWLVMAELLQNMGAALAGMSVERDAK